MDQSNPGKLSDDMGGRPERPAAYVNGERVPRAPRLRVDKTRYNEDIFWLIVISPGELGQRGQGGSDGRLFDPAGASNPSDITGRLERLQSSMPAVARWRRFSGVMDECTPENRWVFQSRYRPDDRYIDGIRGFKGAFGDLSTLVWDLTGLRDPKNSTPLLKRVLLTARRHNLPIEEREDQDGKKVQRFLTKDEARRKWAVILRVEAGEVTLEKYASRYPEDAHLLSSEATRDMLKARVSHYKAGDPVVAWFRDRAEEMNRAAHLEWLDIERSQAMDVKIPKASFL